MIPSWLFDPANGKIKDTVAAAAAVIRYDRKKKVECVGVLCSCGERGRYIMNAEDIGRGRETRRTAALARVGPGTSDTSSGCSNQRDFFQNPSKFGSLQ